MVRHEGRHGGSLAGPISAMEGAMRVCGGPMERHGWRHIARWDAPWRVRDGSTEWHGRLHGGGDEGFMDGPWRVHGGSTRINDTSMDSP